MPDYRPTPAAKLDDRFVLGTDTRSGKASVGGRWKRSFDFCGDS